MVGDNFSDKEQMQVFVSNVRPRNYYFNFNRAQGQVNNDSNIMHISKIWALFHIFIVLLSAIMLPDNRNSREV